MLLQRYGTVRGILFAEWISQIPKVVCHRPHVARCFHDLPRMPSVPASTNARLVSKPIHTPGDLSLVGAFQLMSLYARCLTPGERTYKAYLTYTFVLSYTRPAMFGMPQSNKMFG